MGDVYRRVDPINPNGKVDLVPCSGPNLSFFIILLKLTNKTIILLYWRYKSRCYSREDHDQHAKHRSYYLSQLKIHIKGRNF